MRTSNPYPTVAIRAAYQRITENMKEEAFGGVLPHANPVDKVSVALYCEWCVPAATLSWPLPLPSDSVCLLLGVFGQHWAPRVAKHPAKF